MFGAQQLASVLQRLDIVNNLSPGKAGRGSGLSHLRLDLNPIEKARRRCDSAEAQR